MGKAETKFANTAKRMDDVLVDLLETTAFGDITVTLLCNKAKVNRSTFYAHYTDISDLLAEVQIRTINGFSTSSEHHLDIIQDSLHRKYLIAYMYFLEKNKALFLASPKRSESHLSIAIAYGLKDYLSLSMGGRKRPCSKSEDYKLQFNMAGIACLLARWLEGCLEEDADCMADIILECISV